uniref:IST1-like protein n=1 Tax=Leersia perrieri TaxID=77586 RepID=A0A0D9VS36_9ORYZ
MGFIRKTSRKTGKLKTLLGLAVSRIAIARRPRLARKSIATDDVRQLLTLGHLDRAIHRAEQVMAEDNMLEAFEMIELYCKRLIEHASKLDKPGECTEEIREAAAAVMFAASWCGELPELPFARTILTDKFGSDFAEVAKDGAGIVDPMICKWKYGGMELTKLTLQLVWKLSGSATSMELKKKVTKEIGMENNIVVDFSELQEEIRDGED